MFGAAPRIQPMATTGHVSLTYDGALLCHLETALPHLDAHGLKATFFAEPALLLENLPGWAEAAASGHEIANGALHGAALPDGSLPGWTPAMVADDVKEARSLIEELFPDQAAHSFGFPWGRPLSDGVDVRSAVRGIYPVVRSGEPGINRIGEMDLEYLRCVRCDGLSAADMIDFAQSASQPGTWVVLAFEGVGVGERSIDAEDHRRLCEHLARPEAPTVAPIVHVASTVQSISSVSFKLI